MTITRKDFDFCVNNNKYIIRNVPMNEESDIEPYIDPDVTLKLLLLRDLMINSEIPSEIDFKECEDIE